MCKVKSLDYRKYYIRNEAGKMVCQVERKDGEDQDSENDEKTVCSYKTVSSFNFNLISE